MKVKLFFGFMEINRIVEKIDEKLKKIDLINDIRILNERTPVFNKRY